MTGLWLMILGVLSVASPVIVMMMDGVEDDGDMTTWLMGKSLEFIVTIRAMVISGVGLIFAGATLFYLPS